MEAPLVQVEQFAMAQCPMTSSWFNHFTKFCLRDGTGIRDIVNFTQSFVGGKHGGHVTNETWNSSFHGDQEIVADKYMLCAKHLDASNDGLGWTDMVFCMNGADGITGIAEMPGNAERCSKTTGKDFVALQECASGPQGENLYYDAVWRSSDLGVKYVGPAIPVVHINGSEYKGLYAYHELSSKICDSYAGADKPKQCGCALTALLV